MMETGRKVIELNINDVLPNRFQPRIKFNEEAINELSKSIKEHGVIQPIVVRPIGDKFEIIAGERRYKASLLAEKTTIPAIITDLNDKDSAEVALIENVQRENLTPIEEAISYKKILDMGYITQDALATKLGKTQSTVANKLRLLNLDDEVQEALLNEKISERHARSLLKLTNKAQQKSMLNKIINERLTVRRADEEIEKMLSGQPLTQTQEQTNIEQENTQKQAELKNVNIQTNPFQDNSFKFINNSTQEKESEEDLPIKKFFNIPQNNLEEQETNSSQEFIDTMDNKDNEELKPKKFFNLMDNVNESSPEPKQEDNPTFDFNKMFINSSNSIENSLQEEVNEIENSIKNSNIMPPIKEETFDNNENEIQYENNEEKKIDEYDDFDDDMEFIEEEPQTQEQVSQTQNENIDNQVFNIPTAQKLEFKDVLEQIRECSDRIEQSGYQIETEEIDLDGEYQVIFKIRKNN